jgi:hypothetical protein
VTELCLTRNDLKPLEILQYRLDAVVFICLKTVLIRINSLILLPLTTKEQQKPGTMCNMWGYSSVIYCLQRN